MRTYTARLKTRARMDKEIPRERMGWWRDVSAGKTLQLRDATHEDLARCFLRDGQSKDPADYLCETFAGGCLVSREAVATLVLNPGAQALPEIELNAVRGELKDVVEQRDSLAMMVRTMAYRLRKAGHDDLSSKALDLLSRYGLQGSPLRDA